MRITVRKKLGPGSYESTTYDMSIRGDVQAYRRDQGDDIILRDGFRPDPDPRRRAKLRLPAWFTERFE